MPKEPLYNLPPKSGILTTRTVELGNTAASRSLAYNEISAQNTSAVLAQEAQQKEVARLKAANDAKIDGALEVAAKVNLENVGALKLGTLFPPPSARGTMGPQLTAEYQMVNQEKNRSKQILTQSFAEKDPISEDLDKKINKLESDLNKAKDTARIQTFGGSSAAPLGVSLSGISDIKVGDTAEQKVLRNQLNELVKSQATINQFKTDIQLAKATEDYLINLKGKGQKLDNTTIKGLIDISKDITAKQRAATRGDELYDPNAYETYTKQLKGNNDFFDWRHTEFSIGNAINAVSKKLQEDPTKRDELLPVLRELQSSYKQHENVNKDAYDHYYGTSKRYYKEGKPNSTYLKTQVGMAATEGFYNFIFPFVSATQDLLGFQKAAFETRQAKDKYFSGDLLQADLDGDNRITERDTDIHGQHQYIGQNVTYTKKDGSMGFIGSSVLGASVRTLAEMVPTLIATRGLMAAGAGARLATFAPVSISSGVRSFEENKKWYKDKKDVAIVSAVQGIIEGATESIVPDISYFLGNKSLGTKALGATEKKYFVAQTLSPEFNSLSASAKNFLLGSYYTGRSLAKQTLQEGAEEEVSMFANYLFDKVYKTKDEQFGEKPEELDDSSVLGMGKSMVKTFVESAAAGLLMSGAAIGSSRAEDRNYMRFNVANNPELFKQELTKQLQNNEITRDQYNRGILETGRLTQLKEQANRTMMNLVDGNTLLEDKDQQYDYFSRLLTRDDLLQKVDYNSLSDEDKVAYAKQVETVEKEIDSYENLAKQYAEMPPEKKEGVLAKMVQRQLDNVKSTNSPSVLSQNLEAIDDAIQVGEKTGKGSPIMVSGRQQVREAVIARMEQLQKVEDNGNTAFENQLLDTPVESMGESMQVSNTVRLEKLLLENDRMVSPAVKQELRSRIANASRVAQERLNELPKKEQRKVIARELARVELLHPGTAFSDERLKTLFGMEFTPEEKSEVIRETAVTLSREKEKIEDEEVLQPAEKDIVMDALIKSFESEPLEIQVENEQGNLERVRNEERINRERRAIFAIPRSKSKDQAKGRIKSIFKAMGYSSEDINKALEDINKVFDNEEVTEPGDIYSSYLRFLDPNLLKGLPDKAVTEEVVVEEAVVAPETPGTATETPTEVVAEVVPSTTEEDELFGTNEEIDAAREKKLGIPEVDPADQVVVETPVVVEDEFDGLEVVPVSTITSPDLVHTTPTVFTSSNSGIQGSIMRTISNSVESYSLKLMDMFSFIRETLGESAMSSLENIYNNVTEALKTQDKEAIAKLKEDYLSVFSGSTFAPEQLEYIWNEQYVKGKPDASVPFQEVAYVTNPQFALAYKDEEVTVAAVNKSTGELFVYKAKVTGNVNDSNQIEVKTAKGALVYVKKSSIQAGKVIPINVRVNFNQTNSVMMTAVDRTSGEIAKFNSNGERDSQGDTQLNVFAPKENATIKEVKKNLASGQPISHTLPIHTGARINTAAAYRKGKNSVYLTASVAGIDTSIQTSKPEIETPSQPAVSDTDISLISTPVSTIVGELAKLKTLNEKLNWLRENNLLAPININGKEYNVVDYSDRVMVLMKIGKFNIPFYISTGLAGKKTVKAGKWYVVFGIGLERGWINKGSEEEINNNYGIPIFEKIVKILNEGLGTIQSREDNGDGKLKDGIGFLDDSKEELGAFNANMNLPTNPAGTNTDGKQYYTHVNSTIDLIKSEVSELLWDIQLGTNFTTIPTPPQLTDAKADIERRRKEELNNARTDSRFETREEENAFQDENIERRLDRENREKEIREAKSKEEVADINKKYEKREALRTKKISSPSESKEGKAIVKAERDKINAKYDAELAALERPIEPEVTTNLNADELAILSFDVSALENLESAAESLDQNTGQEIDNAGSCKL